MDSKGERMSLNTIQIQTMLGMTYPMLLLDKVTELIPGKYCHANKNVTYNEWFFPAHYPCNPVMPGMLQIEALTQALAITVLSETAIENEFKPQVSIPIFLTGVDKCRFYSPVVPGDIFAIYAEIERFRLGHVTGFAHARVEDVIVCECKYTAKVSNITSKGDK